jgi:hypothetical protein
MQPKPDYASWRRTRRTSAHRFRPDLVARDGAGPLSQRACAGGTPRRLIRCDAVANSVANAGR